MSKRPAARSFCSVAKPAASAFRRKMYGASDFRLEGGSHKTVFWRLPADLQRVPTARALPRSLFRVLSRATVVLNSRAIDDSVSPRLTR